MIESHDMKGPGFGNRMGMLQSWLTSAGNDAYLAVGLLAEWLRWLFHQVAHHHLSAEPKLNAVVAHWATLQTRHK
mgnify:CR=1 FL=1